MAYPTLAGAVKTTKTAFGTGDGALTYVSVPLDFKLLFRWFRLTTITANLAQTLQMRLGCHFAPCRNRPPLNSTAAQPVKCLFYQASARPLCRAGIGEEISTMRLRRTHTAITPACAHLHRRIDEPDSVYADH